MSDHITAITTALQQRWQPRLAPGYQLRLCHLQSCTIGKISLPSHVTLQLSTGSRTSEVTIIGGTVTVRESSRLREYNYSLADPQVFTRVEQQLLRHHCLLPEPADAQP